jgi:hypothetical protein
MELENGNMVLENGNIVLENGNMVLENGNIVLENGNRVLENGNMVRAPDQGSTVGGLLSVSPPEEHHERRTFCGRGGNPRTCDSGFAIDS